MKKILNIINLLILIALFLITPLIGQATSLPGPLQAVTDVANKASLTTSADITIQQVIINGINYLLGFLGILFLISIIWAGWQWMSSMGETEKIEKAKSRLKNSIIGLLIILISFAFTVYLTDLYNKATCSGGYYCPSVNPNPSGECTNDLDCERQFGSKNWKCQNNSCLFQP